MLSETFKYLYLLFAKPSDLIIDVDHFIFTTEAHLLPLSLARLSNLTVVPVSIYCDIWVSCELKCINMILFFVSILGIGCSRVRFA